MPDLKMLVVDDSPTMRRIIVNTLNKAGFNDLIESENGVEALEKLASNSSINFIMTDWNMPKMDGLAFVASVREEAQFKALPILMVTTKAEKTDIVEALKAGVNGYVVKPFTPEIIKGKINEVLAKAG
jgi:two-component system chemotaxis response regulator CheY